MNYRLRLISERKPDTPADISSSNKMIGWGVWSELSKLPNVTLSYYESESENHTEWMSGLKELPDVDFTLIHSYTPGPIFSEMDIVRKQTKHHVLWMSECPYPGMDHCFTFLPFKGTTQIPLPALLKVLDESLIGVKKVPGSILFDHAWGWIEGYNNYTGSVPNLWLDRFYEWFQDKNRYVAQMESTLNEQRANITIPNWVQKIPKAGYIEYLNLTAPFENFVMTHVGSYEHSIIDMAARGIRVLVPTPTVAHYHKDGWMITPEGIPFAPSDTIERLNLHTFSSKEELFSILETPVNPPDRSKFTDISAIASTVDDYCRKVLNGCNS